MLAELELSIGRCWVWDWARRDCWLGLSATPLHFYTSNSVRTTRQTTNTIPDKDQNPISGWGQKVSRRPFLPCWKVKLLTRTTRVFVSVMLFCVLVWCNERKINDTEAPFDPSLPDWCSQWHSHIHILCPTSPTSLSLSTWSLTSNKHQTVVSSSLKGWDFFNLKFSKHKLTLKVLT